MQARFHILSNSSHKLQVHTYTSRQPSNEGWIGSTTIFFPRYHWTTIEQKQKYTTNERGGGERIQINWIFTYNRFQRQKTYISIILNSIFHLFNSTKIIQALLLKQFLIISVLIRLFKFRDKGVTARKKGDTQVCQEP